MKKQIFAVVCLVIMMSLFTLSTFAYVDGGSDSASGVWVGNTVKLTDTEAERNNAGNLYAIREIVDSAYSLGIFAGNVPYIIMREGNVTSGWSYAVYTIQRTSVPSGGNALTFADAVENKGAWVVDSPNQSFMPMVKYFMNVDGSFTVDSITQYGYWDTGKAEAIAVRVDGIWVEDYGATGFVDTVYYEPESTLEVDTIAFIYETMTEVPEEGYSQEDLDKAWNEGHSEGMDIGFEGGYDYGWEEGFNIGWTDGYDFGYEVGIGEGGDEGLINAYEMGWTDGYAAGYAEGEYDAESTEIDIGSIFDSMFEGVQSIFRSFDFTVFGISVAGTLVTVLVIAIVTFVVRRLMR